MAPLRSFVERVALVAIACGSRRELVTRPIAVQFVTSISLIAQTAFVRSVEAIFVSIANFVNRDAIMARGAEKLSLFDIARAAFFIAPVLTISRPIANPLVIRQALHIIVTEETRTSGLNKMKRD